MVTLGEFATRAQGSHGEQHSLGLALRMAAHQAIGERHGTPPLVILDDVLAALDEERATALFERLLANIDYRQMIVTSAHPLPASSRITRRLRVSGGTIESAESDA